MDTQNKEPSQRDSVSLRVYMDSRFDSLEKKIDTAIRNISANTENAKKDMERRLNGMNEFRDTLKDQAATFICRHEMDMAIESLEKSIKDSNKGKTSWAVALALTFLSSISLSLVVLLITFALK